MIITKITITRGTIIAYVAFIVIEKIVICNMLTSTVDMPKISDAITVPRRDPIPPKVTTTIAKIKIVQPMFGFQRGIAEKEDVKTEAKPTNPIPIPETIIVIFLLLIPTNDDATSSWETALMASPIRE